MGLRAEPGGPGAGGGRLPPALRRSGELAHFILTASAGGLVQPPPGSHLGAYAAAKDALVAYAEALREERRAEGVGVSLLCPSEVVGNLAETSRRSRLQRLGPGAGSSGGEPQDPSRLMPNEAIGPLVAEAIREDRPYTFSRPEAIVTALEQRQRRLAHEASF